MTLADLFGLQPWDMERLTPYELAEYVQYVQRG